MLSSRLESADDSLSRAINGHSLRERYAINEGDWIIVASALLAYITCR